MYLENNVIKHYLSNVSFITGTPYAGKSTMCKMLADHYDLYHCQENYNSETIFKVIDQEHQPSLSYFESKASWEAFLTRSPEAYDQWIRANSDELISFEIAELIRVAGPKKVIVDTNIPVSVLKQIADDHQIAVMLAPIEVSVEKFFDRPDPEKQFILNEIKKCKEPEKALKNYRECIRYGTERFYKEFERSGLYTIKRASLEDDPRYENLDLLAKHFGLKDL